MRRMRSLRLLHKTPKMRRAVQRYHFRRAKGRARMGLGSQDSIAWTAASNLCLCSCIKFSRGARDAPPEGGEMPPIDFSNQKRLTFPDSRFANRSVRTSAAWLEAQRQQSENKRAGARYQRRAIAETVAKLHR